jgi:quinol monooxygenase YgiN
MSDNRVTIMARMKAKEGMEDKMKEELLSMVGPTRSEPGCINYDLHQSAEDKSLFFFYENWADKKDLEKHAKMPYFKAFMGKARDLLAEPAEITFWRMIGES